MTGHIVCKIIANKYNDIVVIYKLRSLFHIDIYFYKYAYII